MQALVYRGAGKKAVEDRPKPAIRSSTDAIVRMTMTTICGTDLHILKGDLPGVAAGRILGHEGIGVIDAVGTGVSRFHVGDRVLISCISACGACSYCRRLMCSHCTTGGWILGNRIDGTQAEYVLVPYADMSLHRLPDGVADEAMVMLSDILPTGYECGVLNGDIHPGSSVAIVGAGPIGLAALLTAQLFAPAAIILIDPDDHRLEVARGFGATATINGHDEPPEVALMRLTGGRGVDTAIEAVGIAATFELCQKIIAPGGTIANIGVHGAPAVLHLEALWDRNITITTRLVDTVTTPLLIDILRSGRIDPLPLVSHRFTFDRIIEAYATFAEATHARALKVIITA